MSGKAVTQLRRRYHSVAATVDVMSPPSHSADGEGGKTGKPVVLAGVEWYKWGARDARVGNRFNPPCYQPAAVMLGERLQEADAEYRRGWLEEHERLAQERAEVVPLSAPIRKRTRGAG